MLGEGFEIDARQAIAGGIDDTQSIGGFAEQGCAMFQSLGKGGHGKNGATSRSGAAPVHAVEAQMTSFFSITTCAQSKAGVGEWRET